MTIRNNTSARNKNDKFANLISEQRTCLNYEDAHVAGTFIISVFIFLIYSFDEEPNQI